MFLLYAKFLWPVNRVPDSCLNVSVNLPYHVILEQSLCDIAFRILRRRNGRELRKKTVRDMLRRLLRRIPQIYIVVDPLETYLLHLVRLSHLSEIKIFELVVFLHIRRYVLFRNISRANYPLEVKE